MFVEKFDASGWHNDFRRVDDFGLALSKRVIAGSSPTGTIPLVTKPPAEVEAGVVWVRAEPGSPGNARWRA